MVKKWLVEIKNMAVKRGLELTDEKDPASLLHSRVM
jgi:hypothetical protein